MTVVLILGNQLFHPEILKKRLGDVSNVNVFMREDRELCQHYAYHKHKLVFFLSAMREYAEELKQNGFSVHYEKLTDGATTFDEAFARFLQKKKTKKIHWFEIEDKFFETRMNALVQSQSVALDVWQSPMFLTSREQFAAYLKTTKKPFMKTFYESQRKRLKILVDEDLKPIGGQWSFDEDNRKPLPKGHRAPDLPPFSMNALQKEVVSVVEKMFPEHPGEADNFWLPTDRKGARHWCVDFFEKRFQDFGPYEDALSKENPFVYHSLLTPFLNVGLLTPQEVVAKALQFSKKKDIPLNSCEGFVRQMIGWREFIRGIYQNFSDLQESQNFWNHKAKLTQHWYDGTTGIEPLDDVIKKVLRYGYCHHIERLMIVGNLMLLMGVHPQEAHRWFMEMFIDSSDWVMGPNVFGMALFSDGGIFATKPYICGSNYYKKMGSYKTGDWQEEVDGLYWSFIAEHPNFFSGNPRLSMMSKTYEKMSVERKKVLSAAAKKVRERLTY
ncbi:MAG: hypothetical protein RJB66_1967 [Pseudomonadota bacterium]